MTCWRVLVYTVEMFGMPTLCLQKRSVASACLCSCLDSLEALIWDWVAIKPLDISDADIKAAGTSDCDVCQAALSKKNKN